MNMDIAKFAASLRSLHEATQAMTHVLGSLRKEAEETCIAKKYYEQSKLKRDQLDMWRSAPEIQNIPVPPTMSVDIDYFQQKLVEALGVPRRLIDADFAQHEKRVLALLLKDSGLGEWFDELQLVVDSLRPENDLLTFRRQIEELLNDERVRLFRANRAREGNEGSSEANHRR